MKLSSICFVSILISLYSTLVCCAVDSDGDLLSDSDEINTYRTDPYQADSDGDGTPDGMEVAKGLDPKDSSERLERPNIIFILADDLGYGDMGVLWQNSRNGTKKFATPYFDQMAAQGMILNQHYTGLRYVLLHVVRSWLECIKDMLSFVIPTSKTPWIITIHWQVP